MVQVSTSLIRGNGIIYPLPPTSAANPFREEQGHSEPSNALVEMSPEVEGKGVCVCGELKD
jgi:hypothetical protein